MKDAVGAVLPLGPQPEVFVQTARMLLARSALDGVELVRLTDRRHCRFLGRRSSTRFNFHNPH